MPKSGKLVDVAFKYAPSMGAVGEGFMLRRRVLLGVNDDREAYERAAALAPRAADFLRSQRLGQQTTNEWLLEDPDLGRKLKGWQRRLLSGPFRDLWDDSKNNELSAAASELCAIADNLWGLGLRVALVALAPRPTVTVTSQRFNEEHSLAISYSFDFLRLTTAFVELALRDPIDIMLLGELMGPKVHGEVSLDMLRVAIVRFYASQERLTNGYGWLDSRRGLVRAFFSSGYGGHRSINVAHLFVIAHEIAHYVIRMHLENPDRQDGAQIGEALRMYCGNEEIVADVVAHRLVAAHSHSDAVATSAMILALCSAHVLSTAIYARLPTSHPYPAQRLRTILGQPKFPAPAFVNPERVVFLSTATSFVPPVSAASWQTIRRACARGSLRAGPSTSKAIEIAQIADAIFGLWRLLTDRRPEIRSFAQEAILNVGNASPSLAGRLITEVALAEVAKREKLSRICALLEIHDSLAKQRLTGADSITCWDLIALILAHSQAIANVGDEETGYLMAILASGLFVDIEQLEYWKGISWNWMGFSA